ncbi:MAG: sensor histidine kinase, partial [Ferruginibacter sp.]
LPSMKFLSVNEAATLFYGFSKEEFLNINMNEKSTKTVQKKKAIISNNSQSLTTTGVWKQKTKEEKDVVVNVIAHNIIYQGESARLVLANDITDKIIAEEKLKTSHAELRELAVHLQNIRESERTHMAREIHDELGQQLTGLKMDISWMNKKIPIEDKEVKEKMKETLKLIDGTVNTVRRLATQLRPSILDDLGVVAAMEWQSEEFQKRSQIDTEFKSEVSAVQIPPELATGLFRIYQESLTNILRHSNATKVKASLTIQNEQLIFTIHDNGVGFNTGEINIKKTHGLLGMNERTKIMGGSYKISSSPGNGTLVSISVPFETKSSVL